MGYAEKRGDYWRGRYKLSPGAFGPAPTGFPIAFSESDLYAYGLVNLVIILIGVGLTVGMHAWRTRRRTQKDVITGALIRDPASGRPSVWTDSLTPSPSETRQAALITSYLSS